jgi:hypothetical protein
MELEGSLPCSQDRNTGPLSWAGLIQTTPSQLVSLRSILLLAFRKV